MNSALRYFEPILLIFAVSVLINYPWELGQSPFYQGMSDFGDAFWHCFRASLGDGVLVLLIFACGLLMLRRMDWFEHPGARGYLVMLVAGLAIAVVVEWAAVQVAQRWAYTDRMPRLPGLGIGIMPLVQMLVLPPLIFRIVAAIERRRRR